MYISCIEAAWSRRPLAAIKCLARPPDYPCTKPPQRDQFRPTAAALAAALVITNIDLDHLGKNEAYIPPVKIRRVKSQIHLAGLTVTINRGIFRHTIVRGL